MTAHYMQLPVGRAAEILEGPAIPNELDLLTFPLQGHDPAVSRGDAVVHGAILAVHPEPAVGDVVASHGGEVEDVTDEHILLRPTAAAEPAPPVKLHILSGEELRAALKQMGHTVTGLHPAPLLVVNAMNPEPGVAVSETLLTHENETVAKGLELAMAACGARKAVLVRGRGSGVGLPGCEVAELQPVYPNSLTPLVRKAVTGKETPEGAATATVHQLYLLGRSARTGRAPRRTVLCVAEAAYRVIIGTPAAALLRIAGLRAATGDRVVLGGPMRGMALYNLSQGVRQRDYALQRIPRGAYRPFTNAPCVNCGECVLHCPARIQPNMISRCAEFKFYDRADEHHVQSCLECGLCSWHCPAGRPVLQYILLAKRELALAAERARNTECGLDLAPEDEKQAAADAATEAGAASAKKEAAS